MDKTRKLFGLLAIMMVATLNWGLSSCSSDDGGDGGLEMDRPSIYILSPTSDDSYVTNSDKITLSGTATAQSEKQLVEVNYVSDRGARGLASGLEQWYIDDLELEEGDNLITVKAIDKDRHSNTASITITKNNHLIFFGKPAISNMMLYSNVPTETWITVSIAPNDRLIEESVRVIEIDDKGKEISEVCQLYDDGDLSAHGDEIKGDNIYSTKHTFKESEERTHRYRVSAMTNESEGIEEGFSSVFTITFVNKDYAEAQILTIMTTQKGIEDKVKELAGQQLSTEEKESVLREYFDAQESIEKIEREGNELKVTHQSGFITYIELEENNDIQGGSDDNSIQTQRDSKRIPLVEQTRGNNPFTKFRSTTRATTQKNSDNYILNKEILIWAPFTDQFKENMEPTLRDIINKCPAKPHVTHLSNQQCTVQSLEDLAKYGIIIIDTHGNGGNIVKTRQKVEYTTKSSFWGLFQWEEDNHNELGLLTGEYAISTSTNGVSYYLVTADFFRTHIKGRLPNSIVYNSSCESMKTERLANAFIGKGARTYLGYRETTTVVNCKKKAKEFFTSLFGSELMTTGESYEAMDTEFDETNDDGSIRHNALLIRGSNDMHFYLGLLNGDFENGDMSAWSTTGDGRVITSLGQLRPTQGTFMGIVSTGLGYTENYGCISQSFYVSKETTLTINWNFLSEEFLEYVGSKYQDYLKVSIKDDKGEHILMNTNIDKFASQFTLTPVSPQIVFDYGDVYMTGWKKSTFDISAYQGKNVTLVIESGDVGDSVFDSATLLDEIYIY